MILAGSRLTPLTRAPLRSSRAALLVALLSACDGGPTDPVTVVPGPRPAGPPPPVAILGAPVLCEDGLAAGYPCSNVDLVSFLPLGDLGGVPAPVLGEGIHANDLWGWTDRLTGVEYALVGRADGVAFVSLEDPERPLYVGELPRTHQVPLSLWRDVKVYADHAFIVADASHQHGLQVFDLRQLRDVQDPPVTFQETTRYDRIASAHNIVINEESGFAYAVGGRAGGETCGGGLHMIDVRDPTNPTFAGCFADPSTGWLATGYTHDAQCIMYAGPDEEYVGREICLGSNETALSIADVTDKAHPLAISTATYPDYSYVHQGWVSDDHRYFFLDDEYDEVEGSAARTRTLVWDIGDLDDPVLVTEHFGTTSSSDHNLYVRGDLMYQSNYMGGLRILDVSDPTLPTEIGFFDSMPSRDGPGLEGSWSNYPFFESGLIAFTSMNEGLFVVRSRVGPSPSPAAP